MSTFIYVYPAPSLVTTGYCSCEDWRTEVIAILSMQELGLLPKFGFVFGDQPQKYTIANNDDLPRFENVNNGDHQKYQSVLICLATELKLDERLLTPGWCELATKNNKSTGK